MASTFSNLGLELQTTGENANTWGDKTNVNLELIDERLSAIGAITNTSSFSLPAPSNATKSVNNGAATLKFTGSASAEVVVTMPAKTLLYNVINTTGQSLKFKCSTETTTATIKNGQNGTIHSDGSANVYLISTVANDFDDDVTIKTGDGALLTLQTSDTEVTDGEVLGALQFQAPDEAGGTDATTVAASIVAEADDAFAADNNKTDFVFKLGSSEAATEKMRLTHEGDLNLVTDGKSINFGADSEIQLTHHADTGLKIKHTATADDKPVIITLQTGETDIAQDDVLGAIEFQAPDETTGTDAIVSAGRIEVASEGDFSATNNAATIYFKTGEDGSNAGTPLERFRITSTGASGILKDGSGTTNHLFVGAGADLLLFHESNINKIASGSGNHPIAIQSNSGEYLANFAVDGGVNLYYDNVSKLETASGGVTVSGTLTATEVTATSDERLKSDIKTIDNALDKVMNMRGVFYTKQAERGIGVIAQEVEKIIPEVVHTNEYKSVAYGNMVGVLIEAIKELKTEIDTHKQGCKCHGS